MFVDQVKIDVTAGAGGDGIVAYRRELKVERGGPFGGNGGKGGSIIFKGDLCSKQVSGMSNRKSFII